MLFLCLLTGKSACVVFRRPTALHDLYSGKQSISSGSLLSISHYTSIMLVGTCAASPPQAQPCPVPPICPLVGTERIT